MNCFIMYQCTPLAEKCFPDAHEHTNEELTQLYGALIKKCNELSKQVQRDENGCFKLTCDFQKEAKTAMKNAADKLSPQLRGFVYAGPTFSCGLNSTTEVGGSIGGVGGKSGKHDNYADSDYNRFDILLGGGAGLDFGKLRFTVGYDLGMLNRVSSENFVQKRNVLHAGIGFLF